MSLSTRLLLLVGAFVAVFAAFALVSYQTLQTLRVNGPIYRDIVLAKDVIADVLPPPEYIIETHLIAHQLAFETDPARIASQVERGNALRLEFENRHEYWKRALPPGELFDAMNVTSYRFANDYFDLRDRELVPAVRSGERDKARGTIAVLEEKYEAHRRAVDEVVKLATARNQQLEGEASVWSLRGN